MPELQHVVFEVSAAVHPKWVRTLVESMHAMSWACSTRRQRGPHKVLMVWWHGCKHVWRDLWKMVICNLLFFHEAIIWICCFSTVELPKHSSLLFSQLQSKFEIGARHLYKLWKPHKSHSFHAETVMGYANIIVLFPLLMSHFYGDCFFDSWNHR